MEEIKLVIPGNGDYKVPTKTKIRNGLIVTLIGYLLLLLGAKPSLFNLDRSPVIGFVQTAMIIFGLGVITLGAYISLKTFWCRTGPSLTADFGTRIMATGFVITVFTGMADVFGFGSHPLPGVPFFGSLQSIGVVIGEAFIAVGLVMMGSISEESVEDDTPFVSEAETLSGLKS